MAISLRLRKRKEPDYQPEMDKVAWLWLRGLLTPAQLRERCDNNKERMAAIVRFCPPTNLIWSEQHQCPVERFAWERRYH